MNALHTLYLSNRFFIAFAGFGLIRKPEIEKRAAYLEKISSPVRIASLKHLNRVSNLYKGSKLGPVVLNVQLPIFNFDQ